MAEHLASIFGTEKDRVNCPFYFKIGACRHGDRCSRLHTKPSISPTILLSNMYQRPDMITPGVDAQGQPIDPKAIQEHFEVKPVLVGRIVLDIAIVVLIDVVNMLPKRFTVSKLRRGFLVDCSDFDEV